MDADKQTIQNLQSTCAMLSGLKEQFRVDAKWLKATGPKWLAKCVSKWYDMAEGHLGLFIKRLNQYGVDPTYATATVVGNSDPDALLARELASVNGMIDSLGNFRMAAWDAMTGYLPDLYEHAIRDLEKMAYRMERERALISKLGAPGYIGARLEDS